MNPLTLSLLMIQTFKNDKTTNKKRKGGGADRNGGAADKRPKGSGKTKPAGRTRVEGAPLLDWPSRSLPRTPYGVPLLLSCISTHPDKVYHSDTPIHV